MTKPFVAGQLFQDTELWDKLIVATKAVGGHVDPLAAQICRKGMINVRHPKIFNVNKKGVSFPHSQADEQYPDYDTMVQHFRSMTEEQRNYSMCKQRPGCMQTLLNRMIREKGLQILMPQDKNLVVLNPVNLLVKDSGKTMLLIHYIRF